MTKKVSLSELNQLSEADFVKLLGGIFEHSPWVAEGAASARPYNSVAELHAAMVKQIEGAGEQAQLKLIRAHPELAGKAAVRGELTDESTSEQAGAGLDQCSPQEYARLTELNEAYNKKFGFPFILAVKGYDRAGIIQQFERRLQLSVEDEKRESLQQIYKIGGFRLNDLVTTA
ncbi:2-oxo-4-hydroxy-4-carboxy-5-ureidoimidazoline decarboxylase [Neopusillimonas maritima]|jgi:2-oxo-4-hydroxy-4-carboxy-5-ureidoimidazoline decarboxylase|uniref:2-oxo-4-hydroxy-4-carboxy-5-ureidoimidazoline decarboxylase n=1 Tax=Neopusillimonas maritima TaxID=2026239 RepID=A0A3A1YUK1_9BURK|nr:2-oxo-4-hydroxy-4-carboxy-5-ureidoimidazoline decarboxylase [Neopusillimonas maritima]MAL01762.1 OHCU decarboxylase [Alcaligenaceae bacterium]RII81978.1 OHCU decarboxylase [Neopusillimonas maritima]RIY40540.1 OHCU decarboxylase [Neopusillimonas maritima]|tara:strand:- start:136035 stop:136556 length:522 start_codon:yes stop_codon:yes gene_type:complete